MGELSHKMKESTKVYIKNLSSINVNKLVDAFYDEDWDIWHKMIGIRPKNRLDAERILERLRKVLKKK